MKIFIYCKLIKKNNLICIFAYLYLFLKKFIFKNIINI